MTKDKSTRNPPKGDEQGDFFVPTLWDISTKDARSIMDVAIFRLSKKDKRIGETMRYELPDGFVQVSSGVAGMASVWDYDLVLMAVSHMTEAMNRFRDGKGKKPDRVFKPHVADVLKFCRRSDGGKQKNDLVETCMRLSTTHVAVERKKKDGRTICEGETLISRYKVIQNKTGYPEYLEIEMSDWMYREITEGSNPDVLTVHPDYFLIDPGIARFVYRLARRSAGKDSARWAFATIYERSGSTGPLKKFNFNLRKLIKSNDLPEYHLTEEAGKQGDPMLVIRHLGTLQPQLSLDTPAAKLPSKLSDKKQVRKDITAAIMDMTM